MAKLQISQPQTLVNYLDKASYNEIANQYYQDAIYFYKYSVDWGKEINIKIVKEMYAYA